MIVTWLCSHLQSSSSESLPHNEVYMKYKSAYPDEEVSLNVFTKILIKLFPNVKVSIPRDGPDGKRKRAYKGLSYVSPSEKREITISSLTHYSGKFCWMTKSDNIAKLFINSDLFSNGNPIMKQVILDFENKSWMLLVRGLEIDKENLGISSEFDLTEQSLQTILHIVHSIRLCTGVDRKNKENVPKQIVAENISSSSETKQIQKLRVSSCLNMISFLSTGMTCSKCISGISKFRNISNKQTNVNIMSAGDEMDLTRILDVVFPGASPELKTFLKTQHDTLKSKKVKKCDGTDKL